LACVTSAHCWPLLSVVGRALSWQPSWMRRRSRSRSGREMGNWQSKFGSQLGLSLKLEQEGVPFAGDWRRPELQPEFGPFPVALVPFPVIIWRSNIVRISVESCASLGALLQFCSSAPSSMGRLVWVRAQLFAGTIQASLCAGKSGAYLCALAARVQCAPLATLVISSSQKPIQSESKAPATGRHKQRGQWTASQQTSQRKSQRANRANRAKSQRALRVLIASERDKQLTCVQRPAKQQAAASPIRMISFHLAPLLIWCTSIQH